MKEQKREATLGWPSKKSQRILSNILDLVKIVSYNSQNSFTRGVLAVCSRQLPLPRQQKTERHNSPLAVKENNGISKMEFKSLNDSFSNHFIKSIPVLTRLNLTANEIKLIELVLSYTRNEKKKQTFYMNHSEIAEHLVVRDTLTKAKSVGNIIGKLKKKGYIDTVTIPNFNGQNGGSSTTITVNETFLEAQLHAAFNCLEVLDQNTPQALPALALEPVLMQLSNVTPSGSTDAEFLPSNSETRTQTAAEFVAELDAMDDELRPPLSLPSLKDFGDPNEDQKEDYGYREFETLRGFKSLLQGLIGLDQMYLKRGTLQQLIDNDMGWDLNKMKEAFANTVLK